MLRRLLTAATFIVGLSSAGHSMPTKDQIDATDCRTIDSNNVNWRIGVQHARPPGAPPMSDWTADDFASYIAVYKHCNVGKPYYKAMLAALETDAQTQMQIQGNNDNEEIRRLQALQRRAQAAETSARTADPRPAPISSPARTPGSTLAAPASNVAEESLREVTALSCANVSENEPGWRQSVMNGVAPGVTVLMSHWSPEAYDTYLSLVTQCTTNSSYRYLSSLLTNLRGRAEGAHALEAAYARMHQASPRYVVHPDADRQVFDRVTADAARVDADNKTRMQEASNLMGAIARVNAQMAPRCQDPANIQSLRELIEKNQDHVVKIYNPQPFGTTDRGITAARTFGLDALTGGVKLAPTGSTVGTQIPSCVAHVITAHGEQLWGYSWEQIDRQTVMHAIDIE